MDKEIEREVIATSAFTGGERESFIGIGLREKE